MNRLRTRLAVSTDMKAVWLVVRPLPVWGAGAATGLWWRSRSWFDSTHGAYQARAQPLARRWTLRFRGPVDRASASGAEGRGFESRQFTNPVPAVNLTERVAVPPIEDGEEYWLRMWENGNRIARPDSRRRSASRAV